MGLLNWLFGKKPTRPLTYLDRPRPVIPLPDSFEAYVGMQLSEVTSRPEIRPFMETADIIPQKERGGVHVAMWWYGFDFLTRADDRVRRIMLYGEGDRNFSPFLGKLPAGLRFQDSRQAVRTRLGPPDESGGGDLETVWGLVKRWDRYERNRPYALMVRYEEGEESNSDVTLMPHDAVPR